MSKYTHIHRQRQQSDEVCGAQRDGKDSSSAQLTVKTCGIHHVSKAHAHVMGEANGIVSLFAAARVRDISDYCPLCFIPVCCVTSLEALSGGATVNEFGGSIYDCYGLANVLMACVLRLHAVKSSQGLVSTAVNKCLGSLSDHMVKFSLEKKCLFLVNYFNVHRISGVNRSTTHVCMSIVSGNCVSCPRVVC